MGTVATMRLNVFLADVFGDLLESFDAGARFPAESNFRTGPPHRKLASAQKVPPIGPYDF